MTNFEDLSIIIDNIVQYLTGSFEATGLLICFIFLVIMLARNIEIGYAITFLMPLMGFFVVIGWFGQVTNNQWIINILLIIVSLIYGTAVVTLTS